MPTRRATIVPVFGLILGLAVWSGAATAQHKPASSIPAADLIQPAELAAQLKDKKSPKPLILQVGFRQLYVQAHIPGAEYVGAAGDEVEIRGLRERVAKLPTETPIVIYCGCCPWSHCPNIAAARDLLKDLGFTQFKVLYIASDFGTDWVDKGFPVDKAP